MHSSCSCHCFQWYITHNATPLTGVASLNHKQTMDYKDFAVLLPKTGVTITDVQNCQRSPLTNKNKPQLSAAKCRCVFPSIFLKPRLIIKPALTRLCSCELNHICSCIPAQAGPDLPSCSCRSQLWALPEWPWWWGLLRWSQFCRRPVSRFQAAPGESLRGCCGPRQALAPENRAKRLHISLFLRAWALFHLFS